MLKKHNSKIVNIIYFIKLKRPSITESIQMQYIQIQNTHIPKLVLEIHIRHVYTKTSFGITCF